MNENPDTPATPPASASGMVQTFTPIDQLLFETRVIFVCGEVNSELASKVNRQLLAMERANPESPILLWIDSPGGEMFSGFSIYDTARFIQPRVYTLAAGFAASMGSVIALAAEKEDRFAFPNAKLLIHQPLLSGLLRGSASELEIHALDIIATKRKLHRLYAERTGQPTERFEELMNRDHWLDPEAALSLGLISRVVETRAQLKELMRSPVNLAAGETAAGRPKGK